MPAATRETRYEVTSNEPCGKTQMNKNGLIYVVIAS